MPTKKGAASGGGGMCDGKTWSISRWGCAPLPGPGPDLKTSGFFNLFNFFNY